MASTSLPENLCQTPSPLFNVSSAVQPILLRHCDAVGSVHFAWNEDRFDHVIEFKSGRICCPKPTGDLTWPDSPPIQQLSVESIDGREVALGVGCAGTSHWSVSIEPTADGFRFDWACRAKETPVRLGTTYQNQDVAEIRAAEGSSISVESGLARVQPDGPLREAGTYRWCYTVSPLGT